jgi:hypothetical protein
MITGHDIHKYLGLNSTQDSLGVYVGYQEIDGTTAPTKVEITAPLNPSLIATIGWVIF